MSVCCETTAAYLPSSTICNSHNLNDKWILYNHLPSVKDWTIEGYNIIMKDIDTVEKVITLNRNLPDNMIKYSMLFYMRNGISPLWEDKNNKSGGCFSYKVLNKHVVQVWKNMVYLISGETLAEDESYMNAINGITISPKKNFCIIKIWIKDTKHQDTQMITNIEHLTKHGSMFKLHNDN
jgi:hypothetical protein